MIDDIRLFDVCIICALDEEARAVIKEFSARCKIQFEQAFSRVTKYEYQHAIINNNKGKSLRILVISMPLTGPVETVNSVRSLLEEFHPRFVAMTGICAGYREKVALGDLVAAAYAFHYEEGKVEADEKGQDELQPEWRTHSTAKRILQYISKFTAWEAPIAEMKQHMIGHELQKSEQPVCLIAPIASGMAVQGNNPFPKLLEHNRKAVFLDQEVAAFYQTLNEVPGIFSLAVKGVCDYGDKQKNDDFHEYAARASAIYMLYFIQEYVTDITMPRSKDRWSRSLQQRRRLFLASLAGLAIAGSSIAWLTLFHQSASPGYTPLGELVYIYHGHSDLVVALTWSPDSRRIASASADKTVQVWDAVDGGQVYIYRGHDGFVWAVAWSPDSRRIASGSSDSTVQVWDAVTGARISTYRGLTTTAPTWFSVAWSPDGTHIASGGSDGMVQVWDANSGGQAYTYHGHADNVKSVAWSPDGTRIASASSDGTVQVWNAANGMLAYTYLGHSGPVETVAWSPDGKRIASGGRDTTVQVWDAVGGGHVRTCHGHTSYVEGVTWSPDGKRIASGSWDTTVRIWNAVDGSQVFIYTGHSDSIGTVRWSPNGACIASGDGFPAHGTVQVWGAGG